jgi:CheY-like chemotaxis protein
MSAVPKTRDASVASQTNNKPTILLVEDEAVVREVTREVLEHAGYQVLECSGPQEAIALAAGYQGHIRVLLSDVVMPGMNGPELARRLQQRQPELVTIFMSGYADNEVLRSVLGKPATIYVQKPFTVDILLARVEEALNLLPEEDSVPI